MKVVFSEKFVVYRKQLLEILSNFETSGEVLSTGRNKIKIFDLDGSKINIKSFKVPNAVNKIAYKYFRKSKAERSFYFAKQLIKKGIGTPYPIGYIEENADITFGKSYYISEHLVPDLTYRELVHQPNYPDHENILREFTRFTFQLHEKKVEFLDHSPGNTLIVKENGRYQFFLVDLNRMNFKEMDLDARMKNFSRLTPKKEMVAIMANEYAKLYDKPEREVFDAMWGYTSSFQEKFQRKKRIKKKLKFWKK